MRPAKWYAVKRPTIRPPRYLGKPGPRKPNRGRVWQVGQITVPVVISVAALLISYLGYRDEHSQRLLAISQERQAEARLVTLFENNNGKQFTVENLASAPITDSVIYITVDPISIDETPGLQTNPARLVAAAGTIAPCTSYSLNLDTKSISDALKGRHYGRISDFVLDDATIVFTEDGSTYWIRNSEGLLRSASSAELGELDNEITKDGILDASPSVMKPTIGCA